MVRSRGSLSFSYGAMGCGKSTLAVQIGFNLDAAGIPTLTLTCRDRSGRPVITSRLGVTRDALDVTGADLAALLDAFEAENPHAPALAVLADEAQFFTPEQIEALAAAVDVRGVDVHCFGLLTDFRSRLFPGSARLLELADTATRLAIGARCWCGQPGTQNARLVAGRVVHDGPQVLVGDVTSGPAGYRLLCRLHWSTRQAGPTS